MSKLSSRMNNLFNVDSVERRAGQFLLFCKALSVLLFLLLPYFNSQSPVVKKNLT